MGLGNMTSNSLGQGFLPEHHDHNHPLDQIHQQPQQLQQQQLYEQSQQSHIIPYQLHQQHQVPGHPHHPQDLQQPEQDFAPMDSDLEATLRTEGVGDSTIHRLTVHGITSTRILSLLSEDDLIEMSIMPLGQRKLVGKKLKRQYNHHPVDKAPRTGHQLVILVNLQPPTFCIMLLYLSHSNSYDEQSHPTDTTPIHGTTHNHRSHFHTAEGTIPGHYLQFHPNFHP